MIAVYPQQAGVISTETSADDGEILTAVANSGYNFVGWFLPQGRVLSFAESINYHGEQDVIACFAGDEPVDGNNLLAFVGKHTTLGEYAPADLVYLPSELNNKNWRLRAEAAEALIAMADAAAEDGVKLYVVSAYRSYESQNRIFNDYAAREGEEAANRYSARPGQSEHQLGTTIDFGGTKYDWKDSFADTAQGRWLQENAQKFGFALSYPREDERDTEDITGYIYEPWHFRYIGVDAALEWRNSELTLFEYILFRMFQTAGLTSGS